ncbi:MAG: polyprenyl synthetase family protein [Syntrophomonadaceae bacterium]|nr:polyprenyl synthetase family protein [Syntrophomonadaceae bacterium]
MDTVAAVKPDNLETQNTLSEIETGLLGLVESGLLDKARQAKEPVNELVLYILEAGGKRLRPRLALTCAAFGNPNLSNLITTAISLEMIHMASLIHDDIIDESLTRRGRQTINRLWGNQVAVLAGDYLFSTAFHLLCSSRLYEILEILTHAVGLMCEGEINQASMTYNPNYTKEEYYSCIYRKTACLFAASCLAGATVAACSDSHRECLFQFGLNLGYAYQILDDLLDLIADAAELGKPTGSDLSRGLLTLPSILLLQDKVHGPWLRKKLEQKEEVSVYLRELRERLTASPALTGSLEHFQQHIRAAGNALLQLPAGKQREELRAMVDRLSLELNKHGFSFN